MKAKPLVVSLYKVAANGKAVSVTDQLLAEAMQFYRDTSQKATGVTEPTSR